MQINYCLPIIIGTKTEIFEEIEKYNNDYQYFEVWVDYIEDADEKFVEDLINKLGNKLILLFRRKNLEPIVMNIQKRLAILALFKKSQSFIDLDLFSQKEEIDFTRNNPEIKTILSYHNYQETPENEKLESIITTMKASHPTIIKIATFCNNDEDALRLLHILLTLKKENERFIVLGMGEFGTITRVFGTLWGNEITFAPQEIAEQSAPGQLTKKQLEEIFEELENQY